MCDKMMHIRPGKVPLTNDRLVVCDCQYVWYMRCRRRAHHPVPCEFANYYYDFLRRIGDNDKVELNVVNAKKCSNCAFGYQRYKGCRYVQCPACSTPFCDDCGAIVKYLERHECQKDAPERILLIDVLPNNNSAMTGLYQKLLWHYRLVY
ncbi:unnamed protein product [Gongylonema pulchrum]|uniref:IBR domain-containing protein n=1 Tax=Gongylonema pulchrum TaxID=637853 RepID=A0A183D735_9BILA|nr:unnamed protein product [Gongylonema pulchrum]